MIALDVKLNKPRMLTAMFQNVGKYNLSRLIEPLQSYCSNALGKQYKSQGQRSGSLWRQLTQTTLAEKLLLGYGDKQILEREGDLEAAIRGVKLAIKGSGLVGTFEGKHAGLIDFFNSDRPLIVFIEEDTSAINSIIFKDLTSYLGLKG